MLSFSRSEMRMNAELERNWFLYLVLFWFDWIWNLYPKLSKKKKTVAIIITGQRITRRYEFPIRINSKKMSIKNKSKIYAKRWKKPSITFVLINLNYVFEVPIKLILATVLKYTGKKEQCHILINDSYCVSKLHVKYRKDPIARLNWYDFLMSFLTYFFD